MEALTKDLRELLRKAAEPLEDAGLNIGVIIVNEDSIIHYVTKENNFGYSSHQIEGQELGVLMEVGREAWHKKIVKEFVTDDSSDRKMRQGVTVKVLCKPDSRTGEREAVDVKFSLFRHTIAGQRFGMGQYREMPKAMVLAVSTETVTSARRWMLWIGPVIVIALGIWGNWRKLSETFAPNESPQPTPRLERCGRYTRSSEYKACMQRNQEKLSQ